MQVSTYSRVDLFHGNMFTAIPIVSWSGTGPDMNFMLYHNSANWNHTAENTKNVGFFLGPGWTISYSDHILDTNPKVVIRADGTRDSYTWNGTKWVAPAGVYDELEQDTADPDIWRLKHKNQSFHEFSNSYDDGVMRLQKIQDATGKFASIEYGFFSDPFGVFRYPISRIRAAGGGGSSTTERCINFYYDTIAYAPYRTLTRIDDPGEQNLPESGISIDDRSWFFNYEEQSNGEGWLVSVRDPMSYYNFFVYGRNCVGLVCSPAGKLARVGDKAVNDTGDSYIHTYSGVRVFRTTDPSATGSLYQQFTFSGVQPGYLTTQYRDRRGNHWVYRYNNVDENLYPDGNLNRVTDPTGVENFFYYDVRRNRTYTYDNASSLWFRIFDTRGNLLWSEDPLGHVRYFVYDSNNNLTVAYDPVGNSTRYCYEKTEYPTLLTKIIEPDDSMSPSSPPNCSATGYPTTTLDYYAPGNDQLKEVIDPNGVWTGFGYDLWGQQNTYSEGRYDNIIPLQNQSQTNGAGFPVAHRWYKNVPIGSLAEGNRVLMTTQVPMGGGSGGSNAAGNPTSNSCIAPAHRFDRGEVPAPLVPPGFPALPCSSPELPRLCASFGTPAPQYSPKGELKELELHISLNDCLLPVDTRTYTNDFNALGQQTKAWVESDESGDDITRAFNFTYDLSLGTVDRNGPDHVHTVVQLDIANRISSLLRGPSGSIVSATYTYGTSPKLGLVQNVAYGNGMVESYLYDDAYRVTEIKYMSGAETVLKLNYTYTADDLPLTVTESGTLSGSATVGYTYDKRRRLIQEVRTGSSPYNFAYEYDKGGNRTKKTERDAAGESIRRTDYFYDLPTTQHGVVINPADFESSNNRLVYYKVYNTTGVHPISSGAIEKLQLTFLCRSVVWCYRGLMQGGCDAG